MTVQCPRCETQYRVPDTKITDGNPVFKCTRCSLVFSRSGEKSGRPAKPRSSAAAEKNLAFDFKSANSDAPAAGERPPVEAPQAAQPAPSTARRSEPDEYEITPETEELSYAEGSDEEFRDEPEEEADIPAAPRRQDSRRRPSRTQEDDVQAAPAPAPAAAATPAERTVTSKPAVLSPLQEPTRNPVGTAASNPPRPARPKPIRRNGRQQSDEFDTDLEPMLDDDIEDDDGAPVLMSNHPRDEEPPIRPRRKAAPAPKRRSPIRPVATGIGLTIAAYGIVALLMNAQPMAALGWLASAPILGRLLGDDHMLTWRMQIANVEGGYDQIKGNRRAYVVSGKAINASGQNVRLIEIEGRMLAGGKEIRRQLVYAANQPKKTVRELSPPEVEMLLRLEPNRRFTVRPGESAGFLLVFPDPPSNVTEVACRVVAATGT